MIEVVACTEDGTVESSTISVGCPSALPNTRLSTSGPRLLPPMPSKTTCRKPSALTPAAKVSRAEICSLMRSGDRQPPQAIGDFVGFWLPYRVVTTPNASNHIALLQVR